MKLSEAQQIYLMNKAKKIGNFFLALTPLFQLAFFLITLELSLEVLSPALIQTMDYVLLLSLKMAAGSVFSLAGLVTILALRAPKALPFIWAVFSKTFSFVSPIVKWFSSKIVTVYEKITFSDIKNDRLFVRALFSIVLVSLWFTFPHLTQAPLSLMWVYIAAVGAARIIVNIIHPEIPHFLNYLSLRAFIIARAPMKKGSAYSQACNEAYMYAVKHPFIDRVKVLLAAGVEVNQTSLVVPIKTALSYAIENSDIQMVKLLILRGANLTTENLKGNFRGMLTRVIHDFNRAGAIELLKLLSEKQMDVMLENSVLSKNPIVAEYRLKIELFESVWATVITMRQAAPGFADPAVIRNGLLPMFKPEWCSEDEYKKLSKEVFKKTLMALDKLDNKKSNPTQQQKQDASNVLAPPAPGPVVFSRDEKPQAAKAANEVIIGVLPKRNAELK
jgi:hypothetical protein